MKQKHDERLNLQAISEANDADGAPRATGPSLTERLREFKPKEGHSFPLTRRELLAAGLIQGGAALAFPAISSLIRPKAAVASGGSAPAYFEVWASGGAVFPANVAVTDANRGLMSNYTTCGQGNGSNVTTKLSDNVTPIFANSVPMFSNSGFYQSLNSMPALASVLRKTYLVTLPANILSDSQNNIMSAQGLIQASVAAGNFMPYLQNTPRFSPSAYYTPPAPLAFSSYSSLLDAVTARSSDYYASLPAATKSSISKFVGSMSSTQYQRFNARPGGADLAAAMQTSTDKVAQLTSGAVDLASFDPRKNAAMAGIWNISTATADASPDVVEAAIVYNVLKGNAVSGSIQRGGYDYHGGDRGGTTAADRSVFDLVSRILISMDNVKRPGVIQLTTDGSCYGQGMNNPFPGDSNNICCVHFLVYSPTPINFRTRSGGALETQLGQFTSGVIADQTPVSSGERGIAIATYLNYMALAGLSSQAPKFITGAGISTSQIAEMILIS